MRMIHLKLWEKHAVKQEDYNLSFQIKIFYINIIHLIKLLFSGHDPSWNSPPYLARISNTITLPCQRSTTH